MSAINVNTTGRWVPVPGQQNNSTSWSSELIRCIQYWKVVGSNPTGSSEGEAGNVTIRFKALNLGGGAQPHSETSNNAQFEQYYTERLISGK